MISAKVHQVWEAVPRVNFFFIARLVKILKKNKESCTTINFSCDFSMDFKNCSLLNHFWMERYSTWFNGENASEIFFRNIMNDVVQQSINLHEKRVWLVLDQYRLTIIVDFFLVQRIVLRTVSLFLSTPAWSNHNVISLLERYWKAMLISIASQSSGTLIDVPPTCQHILCVLNIVFADAINIWIRHRPCSFWPGAVDVFWLGWDWDLLLIIVNWDHDWWSLWLCVQFAAHECTT